MNNNLLVLSLVLSVLALIITVFLGWQMFQFNRFKKTFFAGVAGRDLEEVIKNISDHLQRLEGEQATQSVQGRALAEQLQFAVQKVGLIRFNPFGDSGGNLSFCLALLDAYNSGVIVTSMYGREQNRIYTKKITNGTSESALNEEEKKAVLLANGQ